MNHESHGMHKQMNVKKMQHTPAAHIMHDGMLKRRFFICLILTFPILILSQTIQTWLHFTVNLTYQTHILLLLATIIYIYGGWPFLKGLTQEIRQLQPGMMTLIGTAISVAFLFSAATVFYPVGSDFFWELATLIDIMLLGYWIETRSVLGASRALEELARIMPRIAHVEMDGTFMDMAVSDLHIGNVVIVRPGEKVPSDGIVVEGESFINEALLTGESKPIHKKITDKTIGGSVNGDGVLKIKIEKTGEETYLSQVVNLVRQAQESRSRTQDLANRAAALLFYVAVISGIVTYVVWIGLGSAQFALSRTVSVLVIACPHALGLAIPLVVALSTSITAKKGILIRDRKAFEIAKDVNAVVFDKTGTLTLGKFGITDIISFEAEERLLSLTSAVEQNSEHIIAKAITQYTLTKKIVIPKSTNFQAIPGKGAKAKVNEREIYVGGPNLLKDLDLQVSDVRVLDFQKSGKTLVYTIAERKVLGVFALADRIRQESRRTIQSLKAKGIKVYILTGDSEEVAKSVANELGVDNYFAQVLPDQKVERIKVLKEQGLKVAMVGDGINDGPALATADVGIAIGAGTDVAIESADIILVKNNPQDVVHIVEFSKKTYSKMVQNLWWAAGYNIFAIPLAAGIFAGLGIVIDPAIGAILMSLSTVIVAINSQTLRREERLGKN